MRLYQIAELCAFWRIWTKVIDMKMVYEIRVLYSTYREYEKDSAHYKKEGFIVSRKRKKKMGVIKLNT